MGDQGCSAYIASVYYAEVLIEISAQGTEL